MSDSIGFAFAIVFEDVVPIAIALYAAYWAFSIRRVLAGRIYRGHALWLGALCVIFAVVTISGNSSDPIVSVIGIISLAIALPVLFAFVDSTVPVARRSDPLLRSILRWKKLRAVVWADLFGLEALIIVTIASPIAGNSDLGNFLWVILAAFPFIVGGPALLVGAIRSRDPVFRRSLKWIGVAILLIVVRIVWGSVPLAGFYADLPAAAIEIGIFYALYRSARSLAPVSHLPSIGPVAVFPAPATSIQS